MKYSLYWDDGAYKFRSFIILQFILIPRRYHVFYLKCSYGYTIMSDLHRSYYSLRVETSYIHIRVFWHCSYSSLSVENLYFHTCFLVLFIFITKCGKLVYPYVFSGIVHIHHSVWKPRTYVRVFGHCSYSSLSVETSYILTCFLALFIFITKCENLIHAYVFSSIVHIHH